MTQCIEATTVHLLQFALLVTGLVSGALVGPNVRDRAAVSQRPRDAWCS